MNDSDARNINPTAEGIMAMYLYNEEYAKSNYGSMDFYDHLSASQKKTIHSCVISVVEAYNRDTYPPEKVEQL